MNEEYDNGYHTPYLCISRGLSGLLGVCVGEVAQSLLAMPLNK